MPTKRGKGGGTRKPQGGPEGGGGQGTGGGDGGGGGIPAPPVPGAGGSTGGSTGGGGGSSGGTSGGTSSGGTSGGGPSPAQVAAEKQKAKEKARKEERRELRRSLNAARIDAYGQLKDTLKQMGLPTGPFKKILAGLVKSNVFLKKKRTINTLDIQGDLLPSLLGSAKFQKMFPALKQFMENEGYSPGELGSALGAYQALKTAYKEQASALSYRNITEDEIAYLISINKSPEEVGASILTAQFLEANPNAVAQYNEALQAFGEAPIGIEGAFKIIMGVGAKNLADINETIKLQAQGLNSETARAIARAIGAVGQETDLSALPDAIAAVKSEAGQEFAQAGVTQEDLIFASLKESLAPGPEKDRAIKAFQTVEQMLRNRQARTKAGAAAQPQQTQGGRPVLPGAPQEQLASI